MIENIGEYKRILAEGKKYNLEKRIGVPRRGNAIIPHIVWGLTRRMSNKGEVKMVPDIYAQGIIGNKASAAHINRELQKGRIILGYEFPSDRDIKLNSDLEKLSRERNGGENPYKELEVLCRTQMRLLELEGAYTKDSGAATTIGKLADEHEETKERKAPKEKASKAKEGKGE